MAPLRMSHTRLRGRAARGEKGAGRPQVSPIEGDGPEKAAARAPRRGLPVARSPRSSFRSCSRGRASLPLPAARRDRSPPGGDRFGLHGLARGEPRHLASWTFVLRAIRWVWAPPAVGRVPLLPSVLATASASPPTIFPRAWARSIRPALLARMRRLSVFRRCSHRSSSSGLSTAAPCVFFFLLALVLGFPGSTCGRRRLRSPSNGRTPRRRTLRRARRRRGVSPAPPRGLRARVRSG
jgi:hypothetical protein